jgi:hypothetical protein
MHNFVDKDIEIKDKYSLGNFELRALIAEFADIDYQVIMANRNFINRTFQPDSGWPDDNYTYAENYAAILRHEEEFKSRTTFVYAIFIGDEYLGCIYIRPIVSNSPSDLRPKLFDAQVFFWFTQESDLKCSKEFYLILDNFLKSSFKLEKVAYPGRNISWGDWALMKQGKTA